MKKIIPILALFSLFIIKLNAQTNVPAIITTNQTWTASGSPYILNQNTYIDTGAIVRLMPGVVVKSNKRKITVQGSFQCLGNSDSLINIDSTTIEFGNQSKDYNISNGSGAYFNFTQFNYINPSSIPYCIITNSTSLRVENSIFHLGYYGIYVNGVLDSITTEVYNSKFVGYAAFNAGYPIYGSTNRGKYTILNNQFLNLYSIFMTGNVTFNENYCDDLSLISITQTFGNLQINCNKFLNMGRNIELVANHSSSSQEIHFKSNYLDKICVDNGFSNYYMVTINRVFPLNSTVFINNNNFLTHSGNGYSKLRVSGKVGGPAAVDSIDVSANYWNTSDSAISETFVYDYSDDFNFPKLMLNAIKKSKVINCSNPPQCAKPRFVFNVKEGEVTFIDSTKSNGYYRLKWVFGDGNEDVTNSKNIKHRYSKSGIYNVCLIISDTFDNVCDSVCQSINLDFSSCKASFYFGIDTNNLKKLYVINNSLGLKNSTQYSWIYGNLNSTYNTSSLKNPQMTYSDKGAYRICLTIQDSSSNCLSNEMCDTIEIKEDETQIVFIDDFLNIKQSRAIDDFNAQIYPNPNNGSFNLKIQSNQYQLFKIEVMNMYGQHKLLMNQTVDNGSLEIPLAINELSNGIYFIKVSSEGFSKTIKLQILK